MFCAAGVLTFQLGACGEEAEKTDEPAQAETPAIDVPSKSYDALGLDALPAGLHWENNETDPEYASEEAVKGGSISGYVLSFPLTLRVVGPDSNGSFRSSIDGNMWGLTTRHPNTLNPIPMLATHWAYDEDGKTIYFKLLKEATWSDGKPVTADDFMFALEFMRSEHIIAPWYNNHYTKEIIDVRKYDDHTIAIEGATRKPKKDLLYYYEMRPKPSHFHKLDENWVKDYNWKIEPNTGPYQMSKVEKGKFIEFKRKKEWWGQDLRYYRNRFNVDRIRIKVIRDQNIALRHFEKGELETFGLVYPDFWHDKAKGELYDNGYIQKLWFYTDAPQPSGGMWLNQGVDLFKDRNVRLAFHHAINVQKVIDTVLRGDYDRLEQHYVGYAEYSEESIEPRAFDLAKADEYFEKAGWPQRGPDGIRLKEGKRMVANVTYGNPKHTERLVILREEAKKAGIELNLQLLDRSASFKVMLEKKHEIAWMGWSTGLRPAYWQHYHSENANKPQTNNITNTADPELDAMIMEYRAETEGERRAQLAREIQVKLHEMAMMIPTFKVPYTRAGHWRWVRLPKVPGTQASGSLFEPFSAAAGGMFWVDEEDKKSTLAAKREGTGFEPSTRVFTNYRRM